MLPAPNVAIGRLPRLHPAAMKPNHVVPRWIERRLEEAVGGNPVGLLHGPRQSGRTILARRIGEKLGFAYVNLDDDVSRAGAKADRVGGVAGLGGRFSSVGRSSATTPHRSPSTANRCWTGGGSGSSASSGSIRSPSTCAMRAWRGWARTISSTTPIACTCRRRTAPSCPTGYCSAKPSFSVTQNSTSGESPTVGHRRVEELPAHAFVTSTLTPRKATWPETGQRASRLVTWLMDRQAVKGLFSP